MSKKIQDIFLSPLFIIVLILISLAFRIYSFPAISDDMETYLLGWYGIILKTGFVDAFKENFSNYTPAYLYLIALTTLMNGVVSHVALIKMISVFFDILSAFFIYKLVWLKYPQTRVPWLAAALAFALPTVILNSSYWGQCDSIYTSFLLACLYFLITQRPVWAVFFFSLAFSFKLQAIFLFPFMIVYTLRKKIPWASYLLPPTVYVAFAIPTIIAGRPWDSVMKIYAGQAEKIPYWAISTPTMYLLLEQAQIPVTQRLTTIALVLAAIIISIWIFLAWKKNPGNTYNSILVTALASAALVPFILPKMHRRYFYPQDLISLVVAFFEPELWFLPILSQTISFIAYESYLFNINFDIPLFGRSLDALLYVALPAEVILLAITLWKQFHGRVTESVAIDN
jgi:Gpi18-like mannosyltransferase